MNPTGNSGGDGTADSSGRAGTAVDDSRSERHAYDPNPLYNSQTVHNGHKGYTITFSLEENKDRRRGVPLRAVCACVYAEEAGIARR